MRRAPVTAADGATSCARRWRHRLRPASAWPGSPDKTLIGTLDCPVKPGKGGGAVGRWVRILRTVSPPQPS